MKKLYNCLLLLIACTGLFSVYADVVDQRVKDEDAIKNNPFLILPYEPTYILPAYYTQDPDYTAYQNETPSNEKLNNTELKFQFSFKVPIVKNIWHHKSNLFFAYSQLSYWQAYDSSAFFRETNYEPEMFVSNWWNKKLIDGWKWKFFDYGLVHQSNGRGGDNERSWNRTYIRGTFAKNQWMVSLQPWYIIHDSTTEDHNPDIGHYLGYGQAIIAYKYKKQTFSLSLENEAESRFARGSEILAWSFPLTAHLKGYVQAFSGFGQSLIEYNHYTNSIGLGVALNDWV